MVLYYFYLSFLIICECLLTNFYMDQIHRLGDHFGNDFYSIRVKGLDLFSKCSNFQIHSLRNAFHLIWIFVGFKLLPKFVQDGVLSFLLEKKISFSPYFQKKKIVYFIFHITRFGKSWDVT